MTENLLSNAWVDLDSFELRLLLSERIGHPGQYDGDRNKLYLPLAGEACRIALTFRGNRIVAIRRGPAFDAAEWRQISEEIEKSVLVGPQKVARNYSLSSFRVAGSWRGDRSRVQILPPLPQAPRAHLEMAEHPDFPAQAKMAWTGAPIARGPAARLISQGSLPRSSPTRADA